MTDRVKRIVSAAVLMGLAAGICFLVPMPEDNVSAAIDSVSEQAEKSGKIQFSCTDYFYANDIQLELSGAKDVAKVFYTLDSTPPDSENGTEYTEPLELKGKQNGDVESYTVKACGQYSDGSFTDIYTHSYFVGEKVGERFDTVIFSLSTDPYNLYDDEYGIFTAGKIRREYIEESGDRNPEPPAPANYNMRGIEWERPVYVEILDSEGNCLASQNAGMRTFGGYSRAMEQKSIKLYARSEYDKDKNRFDVDLFGDETDYNGFKIDSFKRIVLRNSANDNPFGFIRDETIQECAELTELYDVQNTRAAAVFLNGEYYGFAWIHQVYDKDYFDSHNNIDTDEMPNSYWSVLSGGEFSKDYDGEDENDAAAAEDYYEMYEKYSYSDLNDDTLFNELCSEIDIENFLTYYAVQIYVNNGDWPGGNYKVYRLSGDTVDSPDSPTADGKWRWLIYDTDFGLGLYDSSPSEKTLGRLLGQSGDYDSRSDLLISVLQREDMRVKFAEIMCDLMNHSFSYANIFVNTRTLEKERMNELEQNFRLGGAQLKNTWSSLGYVSGQIDGIIDFAEKRPAEMRKQIEKYLGIENTGWELTVKKSSEANITVNSCKVYETKRDFEGFYFNVNSAVISAETAVGREFDYWLVNGEKVYEPTITVNSGYAENGKVDVRIFTKPQTENLVPIITMADYETGADCIEITNPYDEDIRLKYYYISDSESNIYRQQLPGYVLKAGETIKFYCKNYSTLEALGGFSLGFNLKHGETLTIADKDGIKDSVYLPKISNKSVLVRNMTDGKFYDEYRDDFYSE